MEIERLLRQVSRRRRIQNGVMLGIFFLCTLLAIIPLTLVFYHVSRSGIRTLNWNFFISLPSPVGGEETGGMANALVGSVILVSLASLIGVPIGVLGGLYLSDYGGGRLAALFRFVVELMSGIPSIIVGLFIYTLVVRPMRGFSAYAGSLALAFLMLPVIVKTTEEVLRLIPLHVREAGLALGLSRWKVSLFIVLRGALSSVLTGVILAVARVAGETAPLLFTAFGNRFWPQSLRDPFPSLPVQIFNYSISPFEEWHNQAWTGSFVLLFFVFLVNLSVRFLLFRKGRENL